MDRHQGVYVGRRWGVCSEILSDCALVQGCVCPLRVTRQRPLVTPWSGISKCEIWSHHLPMVRPWVSLNLSILIWKMVIILLAHDDVMRTKEEQGE